MQFLRDFAFVSKGVCPSSVFHYVCTLENWVLCAARVPEHLFLIIASLPVSAQLISQNRTHFPTFQTMVFLVQSLVCSSKYFAFLYLLQHDLHDPDILFLGCESNVTIS